MPNSCNGAARLPFKADLAYLLYVLWPVNLALFKPSPHVTEPTWVGQGSEQGCGQMCGPCGLDRRPLIVYSWPLSPNAKLSLASEPLQSGQRTNRTLEKPPFYAGLKPEEALQLEPGSAKIDWNSEIHTLASPPWNYRNRTRMKMQRAPFALGYYKFNSHDLLPVEECPISSPRVRRIHSFRTRIS